GDDKLYFFKDDKYVRLTYATRSVDAISPPYPYDTSLFWNGVPTPLDCAVEWIQAGTATLDPGPSPCERAGPDSDGRFALASEFAPIATFPSTGYPSVCGPAEHRQFARGTETANGSDVSGAIPDPAGGPARKLLPHPLDRTSDGNFVEDGQFARNP